MFEFMFYGLCGTGTIGVVPMLVGPMQALLAVLPMILVALGGVLASLFKPRVLKRLLQLLYRQKFVVGALVILVYGSIRLFGRLVSGAAEVPRADFAAGDWPMFRGGPARIGAVDNTEAPTGGDINWVFISPQDRIDSFFSSPAAVGNRIYATSARWTFRDKSGGIYGVDAKTGRQVWSFRAEDYRATFSSPAVSGNFLAVGEGLHETPDGRVFVLDIAQSEARREGVKLWDFRTNCHVESSPAIGDGKVFVGAGDDGFYAFNLVPAEGESPLRWHLPGEAYPDCESSPAYHDGRVYFGLGIDGHAVVCVDADDGREIWRVETPYPVFSSPAIVDGKLYVGMGHGNFVNTEEQVARNRRAALEAEGVDPQEIQRIVDAIRPAGEVWCIDLETAAVDWRFETGRSVLSTVAVRDGRAYFGSRDHYLYVVGTDGPTAGTLLGRFDARAPIVTSPAVAEDHVYVLPASGDLHALDIDSLAPVWVISLGPDIISSPVVSGGSLVVGSTGRGLLSVGDARDVKHPWTGRAGMHGRPYASDGSLIPDAGAYAWHIGGEPDAPGDIAAPVAYYDNAYFAAASDEKGYGLVRLDRATSERQAGAASAARVDSYEKPVQRWRAPSSNAVYGSPAVSEHGVLFVDGAPGDADRLLRRVSLCEGTVLWAHAIDPLADGLFVSTPQSLFISDRPGTLARIRLDGAPRVAWRTAVGMTLGEPALVDGLVAVAVKSPAGIVALDAETGLVVWRRKLPAAPSSGVIYSGGKLWAGTERGIACYSLVSGEAETEIDFGGPVAAPLSGNAGMVAGVSALGEVFLIDSEGLETLKVLDGVASSTPPVLAGNGVVYAAPDALRFYDWHTDTDKHWFTIRQTWPGAITAPMVLIDSAVLLSTDKRGMVCIRPRN